MNISNFFYCIASYNNRAFQVSDINEEFKDNEYIFSRLLTCIFSIFLCAVFIFFNNYSNYQKSIIIFYMIYKSLDAFIDIFFGIFQKHMKMIYIGISYIIRALSTLFVFIIIGLIYDLLTSIIGLTVVTLLILLLFDIPFSKKIVKYNFFPINKKQILLLLLKCFPLMMVILIFTFISSYSRYQLEKIHGTEALGIYSSVIAPSLILQVLSAFVIIPLINVFTACLKEANVKKYLFIFFLCCLFNISITVIFYIFSVIFGNWGISILFNNKLNDFSYLLPNAFLISGLMSFMWLFNYVFSTIRDLKGILIGSIIGAIVCLFTTNNLLNKYNLDGANYLMIISLSASILYLFIRFFWFIKTKKFQILINKGEENV